VARRLILDTGVLITVERSTLDLGSAIGDEDDVVIAAITVAELQAGIELADERHRTRRAEFVSHLLELIPVEFYDLSIAQAHGRLMAHVHRTGTRRGAHDLIIAATAAVTRRTIVTMDRSARFGDLPGVECVVLQ
jgi:tRNA(fMet)-specific endonuclease VapC